MTKNQFRSYAAAKRWRVKYSGKERKFYITKTNGNTTTKGIKAVQNMKI